MKSGSKEFALTEMPAVRDLPEDAVILSFHLPYTRPHEYVQTYRICSQSADGPPDCECRFQVPS